MPRSTKSKDTPPPRSWKDLQQTNHRAPASDTARQRSRRLFWQGAFLGMTFLALGCVIGLAVTLARAPAGELGLAVPRDPLRHIEFRTDGVLDRAWFEEDARLRPGLPLMEIDPVEIRLQLLQNGQIKQATVSLTLPDTLVVEVQERTPMLRARVAGLDGQPRIVLLAADGVVFQGDNYPHNALRRLPYIGGVTFRPAGDLYLPVPEIPLLAPILAHLRERSAPLYDSFRIIDASQLASDPADPGGYLQLRGAYVKELRLHPTDYHGQVDRLLGIVAHALEQRQESIERIDLTLSGRAVASFPATSQPQQNRPRWR